MRRTVSSFGVLALVAALLWAAATPAAATGTNLFLESFLNATTTAALTLPPPAAESAVNAACLTASTDTTETPVPGCNLGTPDASGSGALRLTGATDSQVGGVFSDLSMPTTAGLDDTFTLYQYGGSTPAADGIGFVINAEDPSTPAAPAAIGPTGGSLGYSANYPETGAQGLTDGYLGVGFDTYGNYSATGYQGSGCTNPSWLGPDANQVVVRGPGSGWVGYCALAGSQNTYGGTQAIGSSGTSRAAAAVPVEVVLNTTSSAYLMTGTGFTGISVPSGDYGVAWTPIGGSAKDLEGTLPSTSNGEIPSGLYPSSWINSTTGIPWQLGFGWVASTGSYTNIHEVTDAAASSLAPVPVLTAAISNGQSNMFTQGGSATYSMTAGVAAGANEDQGVTMATTLPTGLTPGTASGTGWTCATSGQTVSCTYPGSPTIGAGTTLPAVAFNAAVASNASTTTGAMSSTVTVSSNDANPARATNVASAFTAADTVTVDASGSQAHGSSSPTFTETNNAPNGITVAGTLTCAAVGSTPISAGLASGSYTINGTTCSGLSLSGTDASRYALAYAGVTDGYVVGPAPVTVTIEASGSQAYGSSSPTFTETNNAPDGITVTGTLTCTAVDAVVALARQPHIVESTTPISASLASGSYTIAGTTCSGLSLSGTGASGDTLTYDGVDDGYVVGPAPVTVTVESSGSQAYGSSSPTFTETNNAPDGITVTGTLTCTAVGSTAISAALASGHYTIDGSTCSGLSLSGAGAAEDTLAYVGVTDGYVVGPAPPIPPTPTPTPYNPDGYRQAGADGGVFDFGIAFGGSLADDHLAAPIVGLADEPGPYAYLLVGADGGVFSFGGAPFFGSLAGQSLPSPIAAIATTPDGNGYWLVSATGHVYPFGDAANLPSLTVPLDAPVVGAATTPSGRGLWLVAADGGVFALGDAPFEGSMVGRALNAPAVGMASSPDGGGYVLAAADGGVFAFGDASFHGSLGAEPLDSPITGIAETNSGNGYWLTGGDGGVFAFGNAPFLGSMVGATLNGPVVGISHLGDQPK